MKHVVLLLIFCLEAMSQDVHIHRLYYAINGETATPKFCEVSVISGIDTLATISGKKRLLLPEVKGDFYLLIKIDDDKLQLGPFGPDILMRGSKMSILKVTDITFLFQTKSYFYTRAQAELKASGRLDEFEKALVFIIESDTLKNGNTKFKQSTTGRVKFYYKK